MKIKTFNLCKILLGFSNVSAHHSPYLQCTNYGSPGTARVCNSRFQGIPFWVGHGRCPIEPHGMKYPDYSWDFKDSNTKEFTHCFHAYPAIMIPQIARRLLEKYERSAEILFDPYCGSGTSLVEANLKNINSVGTDLNPLARLIADTKTTLLDIKNLDRYLAKFEKHCFAFSFGRGKSSHIETPRFENVDFWFNQPAQQKLAVIKAYIDTIRSPEITRFFLTAFSETVRESSLTKKGEFKLVRMPENKREVFNPDSFGIMLSKLHRNKQGLSSFIREKQNLAYSKIHDFDTVRAVPEHIIAPESVDIVITSPPYGDSRTTVAYGQYSRLANQWMGIRNASSVDKKLMGGVKHQSDSIFESECLNKVLVKIGAQCPARRKDVESFFTDYRNSIDNVAGTVKKNGVVCYVVGNRTVKGVNIPMDAVTKEFFQRNGFDYLETIIRNIPNKRMPHENSPSNVVGQKAATMKNEFIVVCRKN